MSRTWLESSRISKAKGLVILLALSAIVLFPTLSHGADSSKHIKSTVGKTPHGTLSIEAGSVSMPVNGSYTEEQIIAAAGPSAFHTLGFNNIQNKPVQATYSISQADMARINSIISISDSVNITINGLYLYDTCPNAGCEGVVYEIKGKTEVTVSFTPVTYNVIFDLNGGKLDGQKTFIKNVTCTNKTGTILSEDEMPKIPEKTNFSFLGWSFSKSELDEFRAGTVINGDTKVYAYWKAVKKKEKEKKKEKKTVVKSLTQEEPLIKEDPENPTKTKNRLILSSADANIGNIGDNVTSNMNGQKVITKAEFVSLAENQNVPVARIGNGNVPLYSPEGIITWSFVNLLLAIMGIVLTLIGLILSFVKKKNKKSVWLIVSLIAGIIGPVLFFFNQDLTQNMVLTDHWTVLYLLIFIVNIVAVTLFLGNKDYSEEHIYEY